MLKVALRWGPVAVVGALVGIQFMPYGCWSSETSNRDDAARSTSASSPIPSGTLGTLPQPYFVALHPEDFSLRPAGSASPSSPAALTSSASRAEAASTRRLPNNWAATGNDWRQTRPMVSTSPSAMVGSTSAVGCSTVQLR